MRHQTGTTNKRTPIPIFLLVVGPEGDVAATLENLALLHGIEE
jgi:hypothetical protein